MNLLHLFIGLSLFMPIFLGMRWGKDFMGLDFPLFFGLIIQAVIGNLILFYVRGDEKKEKLKILIGYLLFFTGLSGSYLSGKSIWLPVFWEVSTIGAALTYFGNGFNPRAIKSILALFFASSISMLFIAGWVFLPEGVIGIRLLIAGLLLKSAFFIMHVWYPEAHLGTPSHTSAAFSGLMLNLPLLLFARHAMHWWNEIPYSYILIPIAGVGVFLGGLTSFFSKDVKKSLAYSTIEKSNLMCLFLFISAYWIFGKSDVYASLGKSFLILFYIMLLHHSFSKTFQFLAFGYISKIAKTTILDLCRGVGRLSGLSSLELSLGTISFVVIPGTIGFIAEATFLFLISNVIDLYNLENSIYVLLSIILSIIGLGLGGAAHIRMYLTMVLSVPSNKIKTEMESDPEPITNSISIPLRFIGTGIFLLPIILFIPLFIMNRYINCNLVSAYECVNILSGNGAILANWIPGYLLSWLFKITLLSLGMTILFVTLSIFKWSHKIQKRRSWDCGNNYKGSELSIPSSVISDPVYKSFGLYFVNKQGEMYFDKAVMSILTTIINIGKYWIDKVESGEISYYLLFYAISFLISLFLIIVLKVQISWNT